MTPRGTGIVVQRWQGLIGVKLDETQEVIYFRGKDYLDEPKRQGQRPDSTSVKGHEPFRG